MSDAKAHHHRPTQKQANKRFKSKHASKSSLRDQAKGRTHRPSAIKPGHSAKVTNSIMSVAHHKSNRRNTAKQLKMAKLDQVDHLNDLFTRKGSHKVQRVVAVVPLTPDVEASDLVDGIAQALGVETFAEPGARSAE